MLIERNCLAAQWHVFFHNGKGYGLRELVETVELSDEATIKTFLDSGKLPTECSELQKEILTRIQNNE